MPQGGSGDPVKPVCTDGQTAKLCKRKGVVNQSLACRGNFQFCVDGSEPTCPVIALF